MKYFTDMRTFLSSRTYFTLLIISVLLLSAGCGIFQKCPPDTNCPQEQKTATPPSPVATTISESHMELPGREEKPKAELPPAPPVISEPRVRPVVPSIDKALHEVTPEGSIVFELRGRKFSENASVEIFDSSARLVNHVALPGKDNKVRKFTLKLATPLSPGNYSLKVKNADGATSNAVSFTIVAAAKPTRQPEKATPKCGGSATPGAKVVFLSGGGCEKLFNEYLSLNTAVESKIPYGLKVKFYERIGNGRALQSVEMDAMERAFVESRKDFLEKFRNMLRDKTADYADDLAETAKKADADYYQCRE